MYKKSKRYLLFTLLLPPYALYASEHTSALVGQSNASFVSDKQKQETLAPYHEQHLIQWDPALEEQPEELTPYHGQHLIQWDPALEEQPEESAHNQLPSLSSNRPPVPQFELPHSSPVNHLFELLRERSQGLPHHISLRSPRSNQSRFAAFRNLLSIPLFYGLFSYFTPNSSSSVPIPQQAPPSSEWPNNPGEQGQNGLPSNNDDEFIRVDSSPPRRSSAELRDAYIEANIEHMKVQDSAQLIINQRYQETFWQHIKRPETMLSILLTLITSPFAYKFAQSLLADDPSPQQERQNEITMELNELTLMQQRRRDKREAQQEKLEEAAIKYKLDQIAHLAQKEQIERKKEEAKLKIINALTSLEGKKELTEQETEKCKLYHKMLGMLAPTETDEQEEDLEVDMQRNAIAAAA